jgi:hypothetical protein
MCLVRCCPETVAAIKRARETLDGGLRRFRVRYAWLVTMEVDIIAESEDDIAHMPLPGV